MKTLVIGGLHGNEPLGTELVERLRSRPIGNVDAVIGNELAYRADSRFVKQDLNRSFPGDKESEDYEDRRSAELLEMCAGYDVVLDFHNTYCPDNDCAFVGEPAGAELFRLAGWLALNRVIVADYDCINKFAPNCLSVEISMDSPANSAEIWYRKIQQLAGLEAIGYDGNIELYRFAYRITREDKGRLGLPGRDLKAFQAISEELAAQMGVESPAYPIFIGDGFTPYNYGGLLNRIDV